MKMRGLLVGHSGYIYAFQKVLSILDQRMPATAAWFPSITNTGQIQQTDPRLQRSETKYLPWLANWNRRLPMLDSLREIWVQGMPTCQAAMFLGSANMYAKRTTTSNHRYRDAVNDAVSY